MQIRPRFILTLIVVLSAPFLLGAEQCDGDKMLWRMVMELGREVDALDERVTDLEDCACEGILEPVCANSGDTYINACEARCSEVDVFDRGICESAVCGGETGEVCDDTQFCETPAGCDDSLPGRCVEPPEICSREYVPVCGCDGTTYANNCERLRAGAGLDHRGECVDLPLDCIDNQDCSGKEFCSTRPGSCDAGGQCAARPQRCPLDRDPVCGCDGKTYANACEANASGVSVESPGACEAAACGGEDDLRCADGEACQFAGGVCERNPAGVCVPAPAKCPDIDKPVCGCDGKTYQNACVALLDGVQVESRGECAL